MNKYDDIERIMQKLADEKPREMENIDDIDETIFSRIEQKALSRIAKSNSERKPRLYMRTAAAVFAIIAVFSITLYLVDIPSTRAVKEPSSGTAEKAGEAMAPVQTADASEYYIPEGYILGYAQTDDESGSGFAEYKYTKTTDESLFILIRIEGEPIEIPDNYEKTITEESMSDGMPLIITTVQSEPVMIYANFFDSRGMRVQIATTADEKIIAEVISSME